MIQWWFWYATNQFIKKLIILRLLFIYFNSAMNKLINQLLYTATSQFRLHMLQGSIAGRRRCPGDVARWRIVIYLFGMGRCNLNVPLLVYTFVLAL